jgi:uncharacterized OB-fold protein
MTLPIIPVARKRASPPRVTEFTRTFWDALAKGEFLVTKCNACGQKCFPPRVHCRHCWSRDTGWLALGGKGTLYSHTKIHALPELFAGEPAPLHVGVVDLAEGVRVALNIHGEVEGLDIPIELVVLAFEDGPLFAARASTAN